MITNVKFELMMIVVNQVKSDITEMQKLRVYSAKKAAKMLAYVDADKDGIENYRNNGMRISEIADLVSQLT